MGGYLENVNFLVVDDQEFIRVLIRQVLGAFGCQNIMEAANGDQAWDSIGKNKPDIILLDWEMQPSNGLEFTMRLRTHPNSPDPFVPIIMMTGHGEFDRVIEARDAGINEYVVKPVSANSLFSRIQAVIENPRSFVRLSSYFGPDRRRHTVRVEVERRINPANSSLKMNNKK